MSFQLCEEMVDFYFPAYTTSIAHAIHPSLVIFMHSAPSIAVSEVKVFDGNGGPYMGSITIPNLPPPIPAWRHF